MLALVATRVPFHALGALALSNTSALGAIPSIAPVFPTLAVSTALLGQRAPVLPHACALRCIIVAAIGARLFARAPIVILAFALCFVPVLTIRTGFGCWAPI